VALVRRVRIDGDTGMLLMVRRRIQDSNGLVQQVF
jgi:hypothetical protein